MKIRNPASFRFVGSLIALSCAGWYGGVYLYDQLRNVIPAQRLVREHADLAAVLRTMPGTPWIGDESANESSEIGEYYSPEEGVKKPLTGFLHYYRNIPYGLDTDLFPDEECGYVSIQFEKGVAVEMSEDEPSACGD